MQLFLPFLIILTIGLISFTLTAICQNTFLYIYDAAGRNIVRHIIILKTAKPDWDDTTNTQKKKEIFEEYLGEKKVLIYPSHSELIIEIQGYQQDNETAVYLYTLSGKLLQTQNPTNSTFSLDFSTYAIGTYILKLMIDDKVINWKIIKE